MALFFSDTSILSNSIFLINQNRIFIDHSKPQYMPATPNFY